MLVRQSSVHCPWWKQIIRNLQKRQLRILGVVFYPGEFAFQCGDGRAKRKDLNPFILFHLTLCIQSRAKCITSLFQHVCGTLNFHLDQSNQRMLEQRCQKRQHFLYEGNQFYLQTYKFITCPWLNKCLYPPRKAKSPDCTSFLLIDHHHGALVHYLHINTTLIAMVIITASERGCWRKEARKMVRESGHAKDYRTSSQVLHSFLLFRHRVILFNIPSIVSESCWNGRSQELSMELVLTECAQPDQYLNPGAICSSYWAIPLSRMTA